MPPCEFNERQYEFCANSELQTTKGAYLIRCHGARPIDERMPCQSLYAVRCVGVG
jgi:hypothetical protein